MDKTAMIVKKSTGRNLNMKHAPKRIQINISGFSPRWQIELK